MSAAAGASPGPDALDRFAERLSDRVNPIIVKEVRQGFRTRVFWVFFVLMLVVCVVISLVAWATANDSGMAHNGVATFLSFFGALSLVQFFVVPYSAYRSMAREREEETWVLLTLTGLGPRRVLAGKLGSFLLQGLLYASAAAPFMLFSYYLNGIDLPTIGVAVVQGAAYQVFLTAVSVSVATLAESRIVRGLLHFLLLGALFVGFITGVSVTTSLARAGFDLSSTDAFWVSTASTFFMMVSTAALFFESAASRLTLSTEQYARGPRIAMAVQALGGALLFVWGWLSSGEAGVLASGVVVCSAYLCIVGLFVSADRDDVALVLVRQGRSLLTPGAARGFMFTVILLGVVCAVLLVPAATTVAKLEASAFMVMVAAPAFALLYLSLPQVVARWVPHPSAQTAAMVRLVFIGLLIVGCGLPPLIGELASQPDDALLNALNPIVGLVNIGKAKEDAAPLIALVWAVALGVFFWAAMVLRSRAQAAPTT